MMLCCVLTQGLCWAHFTPTHTALLSALHVPWSWGVRTHHAALKSEPLTASFRFIPVWDQLVDHASVHSHNHTLPHSHTILVTCNLIKGTQDKDFSYSFSILSLTLCLTHSVSQSLALYSDPVCASGADEATQLPQMGIVGPDEQADPEGARH